MKLKDYEITEKLKKRLSETTPLIDFRVFGSYARDEEEEYSDIDIFIEVETLNKDLKEKILDIIWEINLEAGIVISPLIFTREEVNNSPRGNSIRC